MVKGFRNSAQNIAGTEENRSITLFDQNIMKMTPLQRHWLSMARIHFLDVETPYSLRLRDGHTITAEVLLRGYGAQNGMLIVSDYAIVRDRKDEIVSLGYGYSCFSQPQEDEIDSDEGLQEVLDDWGKNTE